MIISQKSREIMFLGGYVPKLNPVMCSLIQYASQKCSAKGFSLTGVVANVARQRMSRQLQAIAKAVKEAGRVGVSDKNLLKAASETSQHAGPFPIWDAVKVEWTHSTPSWFDHYRPDALRLLLAAISLKTKALKSIDIGSFEDLRAASTAAGASFFDVTLWTYKHCRVVAFDAVTRCMIIRQHPPYDLGVSFCCYSFDDKARVSWLGVTSSLTEARTLLRRKGGRHA